MQLYYCAPKHCDYMTLKIERIEARIRLCGELRSPQLCEVKAEIKRGKSQVVLDLEELSLIDLDSIRFLNTCEARGIEVCHSPAYIRDWMARDRAQPRTGLQKLKKRRTASGEERSKNR